MSPAAQAKMGMRFTGLCRLRKSRCSWRITCPWLLARPIISLRALALAVENRKRELWVEPSVGR